ncbi:MAG: MarR family transcriptional regulator [Arcanobacterium sp.]|nr:MarR family transcriptional regulator [Arcanobacterium sp.]
MGEQNQVEWLDSEQQISWRSFIRGTARVLDALTRDMEADSQLQLNEYEVLAMLSEAPGQQLRMSDLAEQLVHSRSRLTHIVHRLEKAGYVERIKCCADGRGVFSHLTETGWEKLKEAAPAHVASVRTHIVSQLTEEEFAELGRLCHKLLVAEHEEK